MFRDFYLQVCEIPELEELGECETIEDLCLAIVAKRVFEEKAALLSNLATKLDDIIFKFSNQTSIDE